MAENGLRTHPEPAARLFFRQILRGSVGQLDPGVAAREEAGAHAVPSPRGVTDDDLPVLVASAEHDIVLVPPPDDPGPILLQHILGVALDGHHPGQPVGLPDAEQVPRGAPDQPGVAFINEGIQIDLFPVIVQ